LHFEQLLEGANYGHIIGFGDQDLKKTDWVDNVREVY
jgi:hypothetical protein